MKRHLIDSIKPLQRGTAVPTERVLSTHFGTSRAMVRQTPMLVLGRHTFDADGEPIEWVTSWYRGDRVIFLAQLLPPR